MKTLAICWEAGWMCGCRRREEAKGPCISWDTQALQWRLSAWPRLRCFKGRRMNEWRASPQMLPGVLWWSLFFLLFSLLSPVAFPPCQPSQWPSCSLSPAVMLLPLVSLYFSDSTNTHAECQQSESLSEHVHSTFSCWVHAASPLRSALKASGSSAFMVSTAMHMGAFWSFF